MSQELKTLATNCQTVADWILNTFDHYGALVELLKKHYAYAGKFGGGWSVSYITRVDAERISKGYATQSEILLRNQKLNPTPFDALALFGGSTIHTFFVSHVGARDWDAFAKLDAHDVARQVAWAQDKERVRGAFVTRSKRSPKNRMMIRIPHR